MRHVIRLHAILWFAVCWFVMSAYGQVSGQGSPTRTLPISGAEVQDGELRLRLQVEGEAGGALRQIGETRGGGYFYGRFGSTDGLENNEAFSDYGWNETELDGRVYIPVFSDRTSLALRAYADLKEPKGGSQIPFYDLSWLGGRASLRGFENYRFRGNNLALFSGEIRRTALSRNENQGIDIFVFADCGQIWGDKRSNANPSVVANDSFESENWRVGAGGGVQFRMSKSMAFRFEVGGSNEKTRLYFSVSRGF